MSIIKFYKHNDKIGFGEPHDAPVAGPKGKKSFIQKLFSDSQDKVVRSDDAALAQKYKNIVKTVDRPPRTDEDILGELDLFYKDPQNKRRV